MGGLGSEVVGGGSRLALRRPPSGRTPSPVRTQMGRALVAPLMRILAVHGEVEVEVPDEHDRSIVGSHWNAVQAVRRGDLSSIGDFEGERPAGKRLMTDPKAIT